jgi:hypothetical protein
MRTSELQGAALDWAVAKCKWLMQGQIAIDGVTQGFFEPSTDWSQGGPIIEREKISLECKHDGWWVASYQYNYSDYKEYICLADTPLIAAMRCYVASRLGDEVELPEELR